MTPDHDTGVKWLNKRNNMYHWTIPINACARKFRPRGVNLFSRSDIIMPHVVPRFFFFFFFLFWRFLIKTAVDVVVRSIFAPAHCYGAVIVASCLSSREGWGFDRRHDVSCHLLLFFWRTKRHLSVVRRCKLASKLITRKLRVVHLSNMPRVVFFCSCLHAKCCDK